MSEKNNKSPFFVTIYISNEINKGKYVARYLPKRNIFLSYNRTVMYAYDQSRPLSTRAFLAFRTTHRRAITLESEPHSALLRRFSNDD